MKIADIITEAPVRTISKQEAVDGHMFGPVYHGTSEENRHTIDQQGFKVFGQDEEVTSRHGFLGKFHTGYPGIPPVHLLGYGIYFTPSKTVAKMYNQDSARGLVEYYLDVPRLETIGFQSTNTMWRWWLQNGYNFNPALLSRRDDPDNRYEGNYLLMQEQIRATKNLTQTLAAKYDAVYLKRNAFRRGIDSEQIVVFDPNRIYRIDKNKSSGWDIGATVTHNQIVHYSPELMQQRNLMVEPQPTGWTFITRPAMDNNPNSPRIPLLKIPPPGMKGVIVEKREAPRDYLPTIVDRRYLNQAQHWIAVKWQKGGVLHNYIEAELDPIRPKE